MIFFKLLLEVLKVISLRMKLLKQLEISVTFFTIYKCKILILLPKMILSQIEMIISQEAKEV